MENYIHTFMDEHDNPIPQFKPDPDRTPILIPTTIRMGFTPSPGVLTAYGIAANMISRKVMPAKGHGVNKKATKKRRNKKKRR